VDTGDDNGWVASGTNDNDDSSTHNEGNGGTAVLSDEQLQQLQYYRLLQVVPINAPKQLVCVPTQGVERHAIVTTFLSVKGSGTNAEEMKGGSAETLSVAKLNPSPVMRKSAKQRYLQGVKQEPK
jgi:hypothetical protein